MSPRLQHIEFQTRSEETAREYYSKHFTPMQILSNKESFGLKVNGVQMDGLMCVTSSMSCGGGFSKEQSYDGYVLTHYLSGGVEYEGRRRAEWRKSCGDFQMIDSLDCQSAWRLPGTRLQSVWIGSALVHDHADSVLGTTQQQRLRFNRELETGRAAGEMVMSLAALLVDGCTGPAPLRSAPVALNNLRVSIVDLVVRGLPHSGRVNLRTRAESVWHPRSIRRAVDFMVAHAGEAITIREIAEAACCSVRTLQSGFRKYHDCTPLEFLRDMRLDGARQDLLEASASGPRPISEIAYRWGFFHMGLFAARYSERFGELPSSTLKLGAERRSVVGPVPAGQAAVGAP